MDQFITEPAKRLPVSGVSDIVVVGGGVAGVAAAIAAKRNGASVCLLEKGYGLGGLATLGNVINYLPLCDGLGNQVIGGLGEELLKLSVRDVVTANRLHRVKPVPNCWQPYGDPVQRRDTRYQVDFNAASFMLEIESLVLETGVVLHYDTRFCDVVKQGGQIQAVIVENKDGRSAIACRAVVDASGDADVCARAGEPTHSLNTNVCCGWYYYVDGAGLRHASFSKRYHHHGQPVPDSGRGYAGDIATDVTAQVIDSRRLFRAQIEERKQETGNREIYMLRMPSIPTFRMTRRLQGAFELTEEDEHRSFEDTIGLTGDWRKCGPVYHLPLRSLIAVNTANLITAGRCISVGDTAWDITRAIPTCAVTGEAAGTATALACAQTGGNLFELGISALQTQLAKQGVLLKEPTGIA
jgi:hypothetical protein